MSFFGLFNSDPSKLGVNLTGDNKPLTQEISLVGDKIVKQNRKVNNELNKFKQMSELNKKLSQSYQQNLVVMVDISKLLNSYASFFDLLKIELEKNEKSLGDLQLTDIQYIENLTREKMQTFNNEFSNQATRVKDLYRKYGQTDELNRITQIENKLPEVSSEAEKLLYLNRNQPTTYGGKRKVTKKKPLKKA